MINFEFELKTWTNHELTLNYTPSSAVAIGTIICTDHHNLSEDGIEQTVDTAPDHTQPRGGGGWYHTIVYQQIALAATYSNQRR
jgi:hypothetical protein